VRRALERTGWLLVAGILAAPSGGAAQTIPLELEFGYRWVDVGGNDGMYRTQINERTGFLLRSFTWGQAGEGTPGLFDHVRIVATDLGAGPLGNLRLEAGRERRYELKLAYRHAERFSALPAFANPLLAEGIVPGQHTFNRDRDLVDVELALIPGGKITPILGYSLNRYDGPGTTTYGVGGDEFLLRSDLTDTEHEVRVGAAFDLGILSGRVVQGWRSFEREERSRLADDAQPGNNSGTVLGVPVILHELERDAETEIDTPVTSALLTGRFGERVRLVASYAYADIDGDASLSEDLSGRLVSFQINRFFGGLSQDVSARTRAERWRGAGRLEFAALEGLDLSAGYSIQHRELDGLALIEELFVQTTDLGGADPRDFSALLEANTSLEREEETVHAGVSARLLGPLRVRAEWSRTSQDVTLDEDAAQIVVPGFQEGTFEREIDRFEGAATFAWKGLTLSAEYRLDDADVPIVRTDYLDRQRWRGRVGFRLGERLSFTASAEQTDIENDRPGIAYDAEIKQYAGTVEGSPVAPLRLWVSAARYEAESRIPIRRPQNFTVVPSIHVEDGDSLEAGLSGVFSGFRLDAAYGKFENEGTFSFDLDRLRVSADLQLAPQFAVVGEWARDDYEEISGEGAGLGDFDADRYGVYIRWRR
jgi:hypothetical protein